MLYGVDIEIDDLVLLNSVKDWEKLQMLVDMRHNYEHDYDSNPSGYPCYVELGGRIDEEHRPYFFEPKFYYKEGHKCKSCGHTHSDYPPVVKEYFKGE